MADAVALIMNSKIAPVIHTAFFCEGKQKILEKKKTLIIKR